MLLLDRLFAPGGRGHDAALLLARLGLVAIYLQSGFGKLGGYPGLVERLAEAGLPAPPLAAAAAVALELGGALAILVGLATRWGALALIGFTLLASLLFHDFWNFADADRERQAVQFLKNLGLAGGFLALLAAGPGRHALDARLGRGRRPGTPDAPRA